MINIHILALILAYIIDAEPLCRTTEISKQTIFDDLEEEREKQEGDSGGPLQVRLVSGQADSAIHMVVGITSFGFKCGVKNQPGVYTRVASYIDWIEEHVCNGTIAH